MEQQSRLYPNQVAVYRNLKAYGNTSKFWSITESHTSKLGYAQKGKLLRHSTNFGLTNISLPNPKTITSGCARIRNGHREVVAFTSGSIITLIGLKKRSEDSRFTTDKYLGVLTLDIQSGEFIIKSQENAINSAEDKLWNTIMKPFQNRPFRPDLEPMNLWFGDKCYVYKA